MTLSTVPNTGIIYAVMENVADSIIAVYNAEGIALPDRVIYSVGAAPHDCEHLNISLEQLYIGGPGDQAEAPMRCNAPRTVVLLVQLVRCIPVPASRGQGVTPAAMDASTAQLASDFWLLMEGVAASSSANYLGTLIDVNATPPQGGYQAVQANVVLGVP